SMGLSNRYITDILVLMKSIFKYTSRTYHILNPMDGIMMPKRKNPEIRLLDDVQLQQLEQYIAKNSSRTTMGIALCLTTGLRIGELCALQWEDIDLKKRVLTVRKTIQRIQKLNGKSKTSLIITEPKSESSKRSIPIPECLAALLEKFQGNPEEFLLSGKEKPIEPRTMQYRFAKILKNVNLPSIHFHALRHMFASNCIKLGFDVKALSEILGHSNVEITLNRYVHSSFAQKQAYMSRIQLNI
ncbi:MAG: site-specific integrase, partial [Lachnospiraceae bacterium]|nr:site-specific integrase [Lachnospiraceae bacterium]